MAAVQELRDSDIYIYIYIRMIVEARSTSLCQQTEFLLLSRGKSVVSSQCSCDVQKGKVGSQGPPYQYVLTVTVTSAAYVEVSRNFLSFQQWFQQGQPWRSFGKCFQVISLHGLHVHLTSLPVIISFWGCSNTSRTIDDLKIDIRKQVPAIPWNMDG
jgi:hypothetical protein